MTQIKAERQYKEEVLTVVIKYRLDLISLARIARTILRVQLHNLPSLAMMPTFLCERLINTTMIS